MEIKIFITQISGAADLPLPRYMTEGSAGMDVCANVCGEVVIAPSETAMIPTGIKISMPLEYEAQIRPRSGLAAKHGVTVLNAPGTVDSDFRGEISVILINHGKCDFAVKRGDRIAQMVINKIERIEWEVVSDLDDTTRGSGGYGHTGVS